MINNFLGIEAMVFVIFASLRLDARLFILCGGWRSCCKICVALASLKRHQFAFSTANLLIGVVSKVVNKSSKCTTLWSDVVTWGMTSHFPICSEILGDEMVMSVLNFPLGPAKVWNGEILLCRVR